jgi:hypothetical protein
MTFLLAALCAFGPDSAAGQDIDEIRERLKDPAQVFPIFQDLLRAGLYSKAHDLLSPKTRQQLPYEVFYSALTIPEMSYDVSKRLLRSLRVHKVDPDARVVQLCSSEFGFERSLRLTKFAGLWVLDFTRDELESFVKYFAGRAMAWHRHQVKRADGWHYAYPPDWTYAPLARTCVCGK